MSDSAAALIAHRLVRALGKPMAHRAIDVAIAKFSATELAALAARWEFWARAKQRAPEGPWRTWGFLTGRGYGKTISAARHVQDEVEAGRARLIGLGAQDEESSIAIQVLGPSGLIATSPPWFRAEWRASAKEVVWPNGSRAYVRTPEVPGKIRGLEYHLSWISELQSWPPATRAEALSNFFLSTRLGYARVVWDATPKRGHPLLRELLDDAEADPIAHRIVRGTTHENAANLGPGYVEELERKYGGTQKGREELLGEMLEDAENALVRQKWIDAARRELPARLRRRVLSIDPAVTARKSSDRTGIIDAALGADGQAYVCGDHSGRHAAHEWARIVLDLYVQHGCDVVVVETNKGGGLVTQVLRAAAEERGLHVVVVERDARTHHVAGTVYVKEVHARGPKEDRGQPVATAYERGRISHVRGVDLSALENTLTNWEPKPGARSPDDFDALVHGIVEVLGLSSDETDAAVGFRGLGAAAREIARPAPPAAIATLIGEAGYGRKL